MGSWGRWYVSCSGSCWRPGWQQPACTCGHGSARSAPRCWGWRLRLRMYARGRRGHCCIWCLGVWRWGLLSRRRRRWLYSRTQKTMSRSGVWGLVDRRSLHLSRAVAKGSAALLAAYGAIIAIAGGYALGARTWRIAERVFHGAIAVFVLALPFSLGRWGSELAVTLPIVVAGAGVLPFAALDGVRSRWLRARRLCRTGGVVRRHGAWCAKLCGGDGDGEWTGRGSMAAVCGSCGAGAGGTADECADGGRAVRHLDGRRVSPAGVCLRCV